MTSPDVFFALVDRHVTGPMEAAGYVKIGDYDHLSDRARAVPLVAARSPRLVDRLWPLGSRLPSLSSRRPRRPKERVLEVGFEGLDEDGEGDEKWLDYFPGTGELDVASWRDELEGRADWDVWHDRVVSGTGELERRLSVVGAAMRGRSGT